MSVFFWVWSSGGRVVKLLACGARGPGFDPRPRHLNFQRLVISCFQVEIWLKERKIDINPQNNQPTNQPTNLFLGSWEMNRSAEQTNGPRTALRFKRFVCPALRFIPHEPRKRFSGDFLSRAQILSSWNPETRATPTLQNTPDGWI